MRIRRGDPVLIVLDKQQFNRPNTFKSKIIQVAILFSFLKIIHFYFNISFPLQRCQVPTRVAVFVCFCTNVFMSKLKLLVIIPDTYVQISGGSVERPTDCHRWIVDGSREFGSSSVRAITICLSYVRFAKHGSCYWEYQYLQVS